MSERLVIREESIQDTQIRLEKRGVEQALKLANNDGYQLFVTRLYKALERAIAEGDDNGMTPQGREGVNIAAFDVELYGASLPDEVSAAAFFAVSETIS